MSEKLSLREQAQAIFAVSKFRPRATVGIIVFSLGVAVLEGIGLSFLLPIIHLAQGSADAGGQFVEVFVRIYDFFGVDLTLETAMGGVIIVMGLRYSASLVVDWLRIWLRMTYVRHLKEEAFEKALNARVGYFDDRGSNEILNAIVTQASRAGALIMHFVNLVEQMLLAGIYLLLALVISPILTLAAILILGTLLVLSRVFLQSGFEIGMLEADADEQIQESVQAGTQGIRDVKLFGLQDEIRQSFATGMDKLVRANIKRNRNKSTLNNLYQFGVAVTVFMLIYLAITYASLSLGALGAFLFAIFRLGPRISNVNSLFYNTQSTAPHVVRIRSFIDELDRQAEPKPEAVPPDDFERIEFDSVSFAYEPDERVLRDVSFSFTRDEFVAFVGPSGAGKSTIVSLLAKFYHPDKGEIRCDGTPIERFHPRLWREKVAVVRQHPHIFNDTLRYNLTIGNRDVSQNELDRVTRIARIDEFFDELPDGYDTQLGDDGVRLSGGQRQRVALARALLKDADVLVLDEATSDLDSNLEQQVQESIESMERDYAMVGIAHRLSTVKNADRIYSIDAGEIVETGRHEELIDNGGQYAELYAIQSQSG